MTDTTAVPHTEAEWREALGDLVKSAKAIGAVHRPVLVLYLFGRAQRREPRLVAFTELKDPVGEALEKLGRAKKAEPALPFWHLQSSPFWEVIDADALPRRKGKDRPTQRALVEAGTKGAIRPAWWATLVEQAGAVDRLGEYVLSETWTAEDQRAAAAEVTRFRRPSHP